MIYECHGFLEIYVSILKKIYELLQAFFSPPSDVNEIESEPDSVFDAEAKVERTAVSKAESTDTASSSEKTSDVKGKPKENALVKIRKINEKAKANKNVIRSPRALTLIPKDLNILTLAKKTPSGKAWSKISHKGGDNY